MIDSLGEVEEMFNEIQEDNNAWTFMYLTEIADDNEFRAKNGRFIELCFH